MILPSNRKDKYDCVKKFLCVECPIPSQCVVSRTLSRPQTLMTVATKIALQMACKMGGELWSVEIPVRRMHTQYFVQKLSCIVGKWVVVVEWIKLSVVALQIKNENCMVMFDLLVCCYKFCLLTEHCKITCQTVCAAETFDDCGHWLLPWHHCWE